MDMGNEEKRVYLCRTIESEQFETKIYDSGSVGSSHAYLKCKLSIEEYEQLLQSKEAFMKKVINSWKNAFHIMLIENTYIYRNDVLGYLILTITNDSPIDKIDAQRIRKWAEELLKILMEYRALALENAQYTPHEQQSKLSEVNKIPDLPIPIAEKKARTFVETQEMSKSLVAPENTEYTMTDFENQFDAFEEIDQKAFLNRHSEVNDQGTVSLGNIYEEIVAFERNRNYQEFPEMDSPITTGINEQKDFKETDYNQGNQLVIQQKEVYRPAQSNLTIEETTNDFQSESASVEKEQSALSESNRVEVPSVETKSDSTNLIPQIQDELSQLLSELGDLKASITDVKSQSEELPALIEEQQRQFDQEAVRLEERRQHDQHTAQLEEQQLQHSQVETARLAEQRYQNEQEQVHSTNQQQLSETAVEVVIPADISKDNHAYREPSVVIEEAPVREAELTARYYGNYEQSEKTATQGYYEEETAVRPRQVNAPVVGGTVRQPVANSPQQGSATIQDAVPYRSEQRPSGSLKIDRVLEEINNLERFNDEWKNYQYRNKRQISKISSKVLTAHLQNDNVRANYRDLLSKVKNIEFISYLWGQVKMIRKEKNPIYFNNCDIETLVEDAVDFYQNEAKQYLKIKRPKLSRKIQVTNKFYMLVEAYNDLEYYLESLLKENIENPVVLNRIATK